MSPGTRANSVKELSALHGRAGPHDEALDGSEKCRARAERFSIKVRYRILLALGRVIAAECDAGSYFRLY
jgi:hypothetical protein